MPKKKGAHIIPDSVQVTSVDAPVECVIDTVEESQPVDSLIMEEVETTPEQPAEDSVQPIRPDVQQKVYLSGPIARFNLYERQLFFESAGQLVQNMLGSNYNISILNPMKNIGTEEQTLNEFMRRNLQMLSEATMICFLPGSETASECQADKHVADALEIPSIDYLDFYRK